MFMEWPRSCYWSTWLVLQSGRLWAYK